MATFIVLGNFTQQGVEKIKESPARIDAAKAAFRAMGAEMKAWYLVMGRYDFVVIAEAPDDETAAKLILTVGSLGNVRTETLRAFGEAEFRNLVTALP